MHPKKVLTIAGSDSGGGAGIQADLKTFSALGCFGMSAITAITAQNTLGVTAVQDISLDVIEKQIDAVMLDIGVDAVKTGMLSSPDIVRLIEKCINKYQIKNLIVDPVLMATSGASLGGNETAAAIKELLFPHALIITPNLIEASILLGRQVTHHEQMYESTQELLKMGAKAVLLKGGHLEGEDKLLDLLSIRQGSSVTHHEFWHPKIKTIHTHGTGCTLASAIACGIAQGKTLHDAVKESIQFVQDGIIHGAFLEIGAGPGPLWHFHAMYPQR
jgi:hydroxymethylpyrimidine/phosphomethylpyrimidine kinase